MSTVAEVVENIVIEDGPGIEMLQRGVLNLSAYAETIHAQIESRTKKPVRKGTVVVALSRLSDKISAQPQFSPQVEIDSFSTTSSLIGFTYDKSDAVIADISKINHSYIDNTNAFFTMTMGINELTIICSQKLEQLTTQSISQHPKILINDLAAVSVCYSADYMSIPNTMHSLVGIFAAHHVNIMEIVSTYTEATFVIPDIEIEPAIQALQSYQQQTQINKQGANTAASQP